MADDAPAQSHQGVGDHESQDLHVAPVLGKGGDQRGVVAHCPQQQSRLGLEIGVQQQLRHHRQHQRHHQLPPGHAQAAQHRHGGRGGEDGVHGPVDGQVGAGDLEVDGVKGRHGDDARQQVAHLQAHMDQAREQSNQCAYHQGDEQRQPGVRAPGQQQRGDGSSQGEGAVHPQVGEVQNGIGDIDAIGNHGIDQALSQGADEQVRHVGTPPCFKESYCGPGGPAGKGSAY